MYECSALNSSIAFQCFKLTFSHFNCSLQVYSIQNSRGYVYFDFLHMYQGGTAGGLL